MLIVDDEPSILRVLRPSLTACGYDVAVAAHGGEALSRIAQSSPDAVILDLGLPDIDGKCVIARVRTWSDVPIIVLSARHEAEQRIDSLDIGADDYMTKPFHMGELQARLRTALRRHERQRSNQSSYSGAGLDIDFVKRRVCVEGEEIKLTPKEYDLLRTLSQHAGQVVTHRQLLAAGWGSAVTDTQFVRVYIGQLRQKLEADSTRPNLILSEPGIGYRLRADD